MSERKRGKPDEGARDEGVVGARGESSETRDVRRGIPGKGFDAGTGYGGAGGDSAYDGESSYGGQAGYGGSTLHGAYSGGLYGRPDDPEGPYAGRKGEANDDDTAAASERDDDAGEQGTAEEG